MAISQKQINKARFIELFPSNNFNVSRTCKAIGIDRRTYHNYMKEPDFSAKIEEIYEQVLDNAEETLRVLVHGIPNRDENGKFIGWKSEPKQAAVMFFLQAKGGKRGYSQDGIVQPDGSDTLKIEFVGEGNKDFPGKLLPPPEPDNKSGRDEE